MPWVRIDDQFPQHPKVASVGPLGMALQVAGLCYCNRYLTDGFIPWTVANSLLSWEFLEPPDEEGKQKRIKLGYICGMHGEDVNSEYVIGLLLQAGIWDVVEGGFQIHDFADYQPTRAQVEAERQDKVIAGRAGGQASAQARAQASAQARAQAEVKQTLKQNPTPDPVPDPDPLSPPIIPLKGDAPHPEKKKKRSVEEPTVSEEFTQRMVAQYPQWSEAETRERIALALDHQQARKYTRWDLYVQGWLRRDAAGTQYGGNNAKPARHPGEHTLAEWEAEKRKYSRPLRPTTG